MLLFQKRFILLAVLRSVEAYYLNFCFLYFDECQRVGDFAELLLSENCQTYEKNKE